MPSATELLVLLGRIRSLRFEASSQAETGWDGIGTGTVVISEPDAATVVFEEAGTFQPAINDRPAVRFTNTFRWSVSGDVLRLEHLRFGPEHPVWLFDMAPTPDGSWQEVSPHHCREDCYVASLVVESDKLLVAWAIHGPRKRETIRYTDR